MSSAPELASGDPVASAEPLRLFRGKLWFWLPVAPLVALDLWSKSASFAFLDRSLSRPYVVFDWTGWVRFSLVEVYNKGTIWGLFQNYHTPLVVLRFLAIGLICYVAGRTATRQRATLITLGVVLAGALGNLYDNLTQKEPVAYNGGGVRDFLYFEFGPNHAPFPAFNVADSCITCAAILLVILLWRADRARSAHS